MMYTYIYVCMYVCMYVRMYVCMYVCTYACIYYACMCNDACKMCLCITVLCIFDVIHKFVVTNRLWDCLQN